MFIVDDVGIAVFVVVFNCLAHTDRESALAVAKSVNNWKTHHPNVHVHTHNDTHTYTHTHTRTHTCSLAYSFIYSTLRYRNVWSKHWDDCTTVPFEIVWCNLLITWCYFDCLSKVSVIICTIFNFCLNSRFPFSFSSILFSCLGLVLSSSFLSSFFLLITFFFLSKHKLRFFFFLWKCVYE